jgi:hypothetical protein
LPGCRSMALASLPTAWSGFARWAASWRIDTDSSSMPLPRTMRCWRCPGQ